MKDIVLKSTQQEILFLKSNDYIQIKGGAGSGKTTVAAFRAKHLSHSQENLFQEKNIIILTFTNALVDELKTIIPFVHAGYEKGEEFFEPEGKIGLDVKVQTFHSFAISILNRYGIIYNIISENIKDEIIEDSISQLRMIYDNDPAILNQKIDFYKKEISFLKGKLIFNENDYLNSKRYGRGTDVRVTQNDKKIIFRIFSNYQNELKSRNLDDWEDVLILCLKTVREKKIKNLFSHIVIDEAQDLQRVAFEIIKLIISEYTNSVTLVGDSNQKIYSSGFTWREVGINIVGRTVELKENLRTTKKIHRISQHLIKNNSDFSPEKSSIPYESQIEGDYPILYESGDLSAQFYQAIQLLKTLNLNVNDKIAFVHRTHYGIRDLFDMIKEDGNFSSRAINPKNNFDFNGASDILIGISTMHSVKGLNLDYIFIFDVNDGIIPYTDEKDASIDQERNLLYVSITRPTKNFYIFTNNLKKSIFKSELISSNDLKIDKIDDILF